MIASEATTKNQPPDMLIIMFHTRPGTEKGNSRRQNRCHNEKRKARLASSRSRGTVRRAWKKLNAMFHAWLVNMAKIDANSAPSTRCGKSNMKNDTVNER